MTTSRIIKLIYNLENKSSENNNIFFVYGNTNDLLCDKKLRLSNFNYQLYQALNNYQRKVIIDYEKVYFFEQSSYLSFLGEKNNSLSNKSNDNKKGPLGDLRLIEFKKSNKYLNHIFRTEFLKNIENFITENIKSVYIINSENNNDIFEILEIIKDNQNKNHKFIITVNDLYLLDKLIKKIDLNDYKICEFDNPFNDEIINLLNLIRIKNNITFDPEKIVNQQNGFISLADVYEKLKQYQKIDITDIINQLNKKEIIKDKTDWLEL